MFQYVSLDLKVSHLSPFVLVNDFLQFLLVLPFHLVHSVPEFSYSMMLYEILQVAIEFQFQVLMHLIRAV